MKRILPYFLYLANVALVVLVGETLDLAIFRGSLQNTTAVYLIIALALYGIENWLFVRIQGKEWGGNKPMKNYDCKQCKVAADRSIFLTNLVKKLGFGGITQTGEATVIS